MTRILSHFFFLNVCVKAKWLTVYAKFSFSIWYEKNYSCLFLLKLKAAFMLQDMITSTDLFSKDLFCLNWQIYPFFHKEGTQKLD